MISFRHDLLFLWCLLLFYLLNLPSMGMLCGVLNFAKMLVKIQTGF